MKSARIGSLMAVSSLLVGAIIMAGFLLQAAPSQAGVDKTAKTEFDSGNFYRAIKSLAARLREKPDHQDNIALMEQTIPLFFDKAKREAEKAVQRKKWDTAVEEYGRINEIADALSDVPAVPKKVEGQKEKVATAFALPEDVYPQYEEALAMAIAAHYEKAQGYEAENRFKDAAVEYRQTREYDPGYKDAAARYGDCRTKAMLRIAVMPFDDGTGSKYGALGDLLTQQVISQAMGLNPEFLQFVTRDYLSQMMADQGENAGSLTSVNAAQYAQKLGIHAFVFGKLMSIIENYPPDTSTSGTNSVEYYSKAGTIVKSCTYTLYRRQGSVKVLGSFQVVEGATGIIKTSSNIDKSATDGTTWVTFRGEEDAIPKEVKQLNQGERPLMVPGELVTQSINQLGAELATNLVEVFK
jgi:hypothetical protein